MAPAMPCKRMDRQHSGIVKANAEPKIGNEKEFKTVYGCTVESHESTRQRTESLQFKTHEDRIAEKGFTSMTHYYNLVHKFIPMPQAMKIQDAKVAVDKGWKKLETIPAWDLGKVKSKKEVIMEAQRDNESPLCFIDGHMPPQKCGAGTQNYRGTKAESYSGETLLRSIQARYAVLTEQGSSASQMTAAEIMDVIARGCDGQAADAVSA